MYKKGITLIIKVSALGDVVRTSFIAQALKEKTGNKIIWVTSKTAINFLLDNPYIDKVVSTDGIDSLSGIKYDEVINLEEDEYLCKFASGLKSNKMRGFTYSKNKVIPTKTAEEMFNMSHIGPSPQNDILKIKNKKTYRQLIGEIVEVDWEKYEPFLKLTEKQLETKKIFMKRHSISDDDMIVGINSGAADTWPKALPIEKTAKLIENIYNTYNCQIILFGGPNEIERNRKISALSNAPIISAGCGNDLIDFPALVSICNLMVSTDSLGAHIAFALKVKTVVMIGPTSLSEVDLYGIGEKIAAKSNQVCTYSQNKDEDIMDKICLGEVMTALKKLRTQTVSLVITSFKEKTLKRAIEAAINQKTKYDYDVVVVTPIDEDLEMVKELGAIPFKDPGKGKSFALNKVFKEIHSDILILTDGDVYVNDTAVEEIINSFSIPNVGCITGRPVPIEDKSTKYGYWANVLFNAAHRLRKDAFERNDFLESSGYLFAFRGGKLKEIPLDVAEDTYIPYFFAEKGYKIGYVEKAEVYVKNVDNFKDWILQKVRTSKAHETLDEYVDTSTNKKVKSVSTEAKGLFKVLCEPKSLKELYWTIQLILARGYMWAKVKADTKLRNKHYGDGWETSQSTK